MSRLNPPHSTYERDGQTYHRLDKSDMEEVYGIEARGDFALIGWSYEREPPETYVCLKCGTDRFLVGCSSDALLTVLKCPDCGWERCIHDG